MRIRSLAGVLLCVMLAACASDAGREDSGVATAGEAARGTRSAHAAMAAAASAAPAEHRIHFAFDTDVVTDAGMRVVEQWAKFLAANPGRYVRLEGHCDERGTPEYNVGLGERRGGAVREALLDRGVAADRISVVSYGEAHPLASGHDEQAWRQNRRVELVLQ